MASEDLPARRRSPSAREFELMAPAGSFESLSAAVRAGADAVYFGIDGLNMRSRSAKPFTIEDLPQIAEFCRRAGVKTYLTVNVVIYDQDRPFMERIIRAAEEAGISAVIASDMAAVLFAAKIGIPVHLSTQLNVSNIEAVRFYARYAEVVVLARELSLEQVSHIYEQILSERITGSGGEPVRIEMFVHGALCMAVSGKCYLSLHHLGRSANRGACTQICRRAYAVRDKESEVELEVDNAYIMSPKDLKTIHFIDKMAAAGVRVFKIEGRARGPEYVQATVGCYREAIDAYCEGRYRPELFADWDERLSRVFNRGFWDGYYLGQRLGEWTRESGSSATRIKTAVGKVVKYFGKIGVAEVSTESDTLAVGDELLVTGPTTGAHSEPVREIRLEQHSVKEALKGQNVSIPVSVKVRPGDRVYKMVKR